jgi:hypothetical protein
MIVLQQEPEFVSNPFRVGQMVRTYSFPRVRCATLGCVVQPLRGKDSSCQCSPDGYSFPWLFASWCEELALPAVPAGFLRVVLALTTYGNSGQPQAVSATPGRRVVDIAGPRPAADSDAEPAAAPAYPVRGPLRGAHLVVAPLPDVPVHVV